MSADDDVLWHQPVLLSARASLRSHPCRSNAQYPTIPPLHQYGSEVPNPWVPVQIIHPLGEGLRENPRIRGSVVYGDSSSLTKRPFNETAASCPGHLQELAPLPIIPLPFSGADANVR